jgi:hypothetical protein
MAHPLKRWTADTGSNRRSAHETAAISRPLHGSRALCVGRSGVPVQAVDEARACPRVAAFLARNLISRPARDGKGDRKEPPECPIA